MAIKPLNHNVVAKKSEASDKTASGLLLPEKEAPAYAVVESVGPDVKGVKTGDRIIFKEYSTTNIKIDDTDYIIVKDEDILATL